MRAFNEQKEIQFILKYKFILRSRESKPNDLATE
jgi:hypothetical protein